MTTAELLHLCRQVQQIAAQAGAFIHSEAGKVKPSEIHLKHHNNLVSYVDTTSEKMIVDALSRLLPEAGFLTEENTVAPSDKPLQWVIDPLDGTTNFLYQLPSYAVSIALCRHHIPIVGVVYEVNRQECFWAVKDGGSFLNDMPIRVSQTDKLADALISTGFPYYDFTIIEQYTQVLKALMQQTKGIRRFGAAAVDLCYTACGRYDAFFEHSLHPWDVAAGSLIVQEAGGLVTDFSGQDNYLFGNQIIATAPLLSSELHTLLKQLV